MKEVLSLNPHTYQNDALPNRLAVNLADIALEAGNKPISERINPYILQVTQDGKVINPDLGIEDVSIFYTDENELRERESAAGLRIRDCLLNKPVGTVAVWLSPPNPQYKYEEGRITVGHNCNNINNVKIMDSYGIPTTEFTPEDYLHIGWKLSELTDDVLKLESPEDLRGNPIIFYLQPDISPWTLLKSYIPLEEVWETIESGEVHAKRVNALEAAYRVAPQVFEQIQSAQDSYDLINAIKFGEREMANNGFSIDISKLACEFEVAMTTETSYIQTYTSLTANKTLQMVTVDAGDGLGPLEFKANCGHKNKRPFGKLLSHCESCGKQINCN